MSIAWTGWSVRLGFTDVLWENTQSFCIASFSQVALSSQVFHHNRIQCPPFIRVVHPIQGHRDMFEILIGYLWTSLVYPHPSELLCLLKSHIVSSSNYRSFIQKVGPIQGHAGMFRENTDHIELPRYKYPHSSPNSFSALLFRLFCSMNSPLIEISPLACVLSEFPRHPWIITISLTELPSLCTSTLKLSRKEHWTQG